MNDDNRHDDMFSGKSSEANNEEVNFILKDSPDYHYPSRNYIYSNDNNRKRGLFSYFLVAMIGALIGGVISVYIAPYLPYQNSDFNTRYEGDFDSTQEIKITPTEDIGIVEAVAKKSMRSVVGITTIQRGIDYFLGEVERQGLGSGVIVSSDGYIITNSHVVAYGQADKITVLFEDGTTKPGRVLWHSDIYDLAIVKVDITNLPPAELGDSDNLKVGEVAVAIGNPLGLEFERTVTSGVISGLNRTVVIENNQKIEDLIQTDASINPGNSGGPLLNGRGEVIGINTAKISGGEGLGLAIPINAVKPIISRMIDEGEFKQVFIGIQGIAVEKYEQALAIELNADQGIYIIEVIADSPAHESGLIAGDVLLKIDNEEVNSMNELRNLLLHYKPGEAVKLTILRNDSESILDIIFIERPDNQ